MSLYATAAAQTISAVAEGFGSVSATSRAAYDDSYRAATERRNANERRFAAEANLAKLKVDTVMNNVNIERNAMQAKAAATLSAAVSGAEGGSVDAVMQDIDNNESFAKYAANRQEEARKEQLLSEVYGSVSQREAITEGTNSTATGLMKAFSSVTRDDFLTAGQLFQSETKLNNLEDYQHSGFGKDEVAPVYDNTYMGMGDAIA